MFSPKSFRLTLLYPVSDIIHRHLMARSSLMLRNMASSTKWTSLIPYHALIPLPDQIHTLGIEFFDNRNDSQSVLNHRARWIACSCYIHSAGLSVSDGRPRSLLFRLLRTHFPPCSLSSVLCSTTFFLRMSWLALCCSSTSIVNSRLVLAEYIMQELSRFASPLATFVWDPDGSGESRTIAATTHYS